MAQGLGVLLGLFVPPKDSEGSGLSQLHAPLFFFPSCSRTLCSDDFFFSCRTRAGSRVLSARGHSSTLSAGLTGSGPQRMRGVQCGAVPAGCCLPARPAASASVLQPREKGRMRFHRLQNVQIALDFLKQRQVRAAREHAGALVIGAAAGAERDGRGWSGTPSPG